MNRKEIIKFGKNQKEAKNNNLAINNFIFSQDFYLNTCVGLPLC